MELAGTTVLVTGAAQRIGRALAVALGKEGCRVAVHYSRSRHEAEQLVDSLRRSGAEAVAVRQDFETRPVEAARDLVAQSRAALGDIQVLINNAAIFEAARLAETTEATYDRHMAVNLKAPFFLCREFAESLEAECGHIINIADWRGTWPQHEHLAYSLTKSALISLTQALARDLGPRIQSNAIAPGAILPPPGEDPSYLEAVKDRNCLKRHGGPDDIVETVLYLLRSDFVTGEVIHVNGGEHL